MKLQAFPPALLLLNLSLIPTASAQTSPQASPQAGMTCIPVRTNACAALRFTNGSVAKVLRVTQSTNLLTALPQVGLMGARPTLVLVGGAAGLSADDLSRLRQLFVKAIAPLANSLNAYVVDGGTDYGVMQLMGQARTETRSNFPLIGVAATGTLLPPIGQVGSLLPDAAALEPNHTQFVLVPGQQFGDESPWIAKVASVLANRRSSVTLVVNGGRITMEDVANSVAAGRRVIVLDGTGRAANELAAALRKEPAGEQAKTLAASGLLQSVNAASGADSLEKAIRSVLTH